MALFDYIGHEFIEAVAHQLLVAGLQCLALFISPAVHELALEILLSLQLIGGVTDEKATMIYLSAHSATDVAACAGP